MIDYPRHSTGRAYARALEIIGYIVAVLGVISGIVTMAQVSFFAGLGYLLGSVVTGIGLFVLGELVLTFFHIEYNTTIMREHMVAGALAAQLPVAAQEQEGRRRDVASHPSERAPAHPQAHDAHARGDLSPGNPSNP